MSTSIFPFSVTLRIVCAIEASLSTVQRQTATLCIYDERAPDEQVVLSVQSTNPRSSSSARIEVLSTVNGDLLFEYSDIMSEVDLRARVECDSRLDEKLNLFFIVAILTQVKNCMRMFADYAEFLVPHQAIVAVNWPVVIECQDTADFAGYLRLMSLSDALVESDA